MLDIVPKAPHIVECQNFGRKKNTWKDFCGILKNVKNPSWNHLFSTYAKFSEWLTFLLKNVTFSENFAHVQNEWFPYRP